MRTERVVSIGLLKIDIEGDEIEVVRGIDDGDWARIEQVVIEVHTLEKRAAVVDLLERQYEVVGERRDVELERCGLSHAIVYARCPRRERPPRPVVSG